MNKKFLKLNVRGFTLIELLIVIAILGTLAVVVLLALNPVQQLAAARDSGRSSTVAQLGHAMEAHATANGGSYNPDAAAGTCGVVAGVPQNTSTTWITTCLVGTGELKAVPAAIGYTSLAAAPACPGTSVSENGWCYDGTAANMVVFTQAEATRNTAKCAAGQTAYWVYATAAGRGGLWCNASAPVAAFSGGTWVN